MTDNFNLYSKYYDLLYLNKEYEKESRYVTKTLREFLPAIESILELGCGSGSHADFLCQYGFEITGIDRSFEMIKEALNKNIVGFNPIQGDISRFNLENQFDAVIALFHVISYLVDNKSLINCFQLTHKHLKKGGLFLFDTWYSNAVYNNKPDTRIKRLEDDKVEIIRIAEPCVISSKNLVEVHYEVIIKNKKTGEIQIFKEKHPMRHFSIPEIELLAWETGFEIIKTEELITQASPNDNTWGVCFILKKI